MPHLSRAAPEREVAGAPRVAAACGIGAAVVGALVIGIGWTLHVAIVRELVPGTVTMKASTALMFVLLGVGLPLVPGEDRRRHAGWVCAAACAIIALAFLSEYIFGWKLGIDELPFRDTPGHKAQIAYPGRPAPTTLFCFLLVSISELALHRRSRISEALVVPVLGIAAMCVLGYAYKIPAFYGPASAAKMALNTGVTFLVLVTGVMFAVPRGRLQRILSIDDSGGMMERRLLPLAVLVPLVLGWLRLVGQEAGIFGLRVGTWILTMATIGCLVGVIALAGASLSRTDSQRRRLEGLLQRAADEDELTRLPNRRGFTERLRHELALASRHGTPGALLMIDLDEFKSVNDEHGHAAGDRLLRSVGDTMRQRLRDTDALGRLGGDEFVAYLPQTDAAGADRVAEQLVVLIHETSVALGEGMGTTVSIGVAFDSSGSLDQEAILKAADDAMYRAKRAGGNRARTWKPLTPVPAALGDGRLLTPTR